MTEQNTTLITPQSPEEVALLKEIDVAFNGGLKREVRQNYSEPFAKEEVKKSLDKIMETIDLPEVQKFLKGE